MVPPLSQTSFICSLWLCYVETRAPFALHHWAVSWQCLLSSLSASVFGPSCSRSPLSSMSLSSLLELVRVLTLPLTEPQPYLWPRGMGTSLFFHSVHWVITFHTSKLSTHHSNRPKYLVENGTLHNVYRHFSCLNFQWIDIKYVYITFLLP